MTIKVEWIDRGYEPQSPPDPAYPQGMDFDLTQRHPGCQVAVPCPARRCGFYVLTCERCGSNAVVTTAGRPDDPRSVRLKCHPQGRA